MIFFVFQLRNRLSHDIGQQVDQTGTRLHFGPVGREREAMLRDLQQGHAEGPDVGGDGVRLPGDPFGGHVVGRADKRVGVTFGAELATHSEIAQFHLTIATQEDVRWFDICPGISGKRASGTRAETEKHLPRWMIFRLWRYVNPFNTPSATLPSTFSPVRPPSFLTSL